MKNWLQRQKRNWECRTNTVCGFVRLRAINDSRPRFLLRVGDGSDGLCKFEVGTRRWLIYAEWDVWEREHRFQWSTALPLPADARAE